MKKKGSGASDEPVPGASIARGCSKAGKWQTRPVPCRLKPAPAEGRLPASWQERPEKASNLLPEFP